MKVYVRSRMARIVFLTMTVLVIGGAGGAMWKATAQGDEMDKALETLPQVCLSSDELPGFRLIGPGQPEAKRTGVAGMSQEFRRESTQKRDGKDPTTIRVTIGIAPDPNIARRVALMASDSQSGGLPRGSFSGQPLGKTCWASAPQTRIGAATLVVLDGRSIVVVQIMYTGIDYRDQHPSTGKTEFQSLTPEDQELAEGAARLALARLARHNLLGKATDKPATIFVGEEKVQGRVVKDIVVAPAQEILERLGAKAQLNARLHSVSGRVKGKQVTAAAGAYEVLVGDKKVALPCPVLMAENQPVVAVEAFCKALGLKAQRDKQTNIVKIG
jgi:hypothetical protein